MADNQHQFIIEEASLTRPLGFTGEDYPYQKGRIKMYIKSTQYRIQLIITNEDIPIPKPKAEWADDDLVIMEIKTKSHIHLHVPYQNMSTTRSTD